MNTALEILLSLQEISHDLKESQATSVTLLRRHFTGRQLEVSIEANGRLPGWVITVEITEVMLKGLPAYLTFQRAIQRLNQSYLKFQKEVIEVLPKGLGGGTKHSRPSSALESNKVEVSEEEVLQSVEAISNGEERRVVREAVKGLLKNDPEKKNLSENQIGNEGAQTLEAALQTNDTLQVLNFEHNQIIVEGIITEKQIESLLQANKQIAILFQQQIKEIQEFLQSHQNNESIPLEHLPQLKELLSKWHTDSNDLIPSLPEILRQSGKTNLNDLYKENLEGSIKNLTNRLHNLWIESFEKKIAALSNECVMGKESSIERNVDLGYTLYKTWLAFLGSDWLENHLQTLIPFEVLLDIAEGGNKQDVRELKDPHLLFNEFFRLEMNRKIYF